MDVKVFLKGIRAERMEIASLSEAREQLESTLLPKAIRYDVDKVQTSVSDRLFVVIADLNELDRKLEKRIIKLSADVSLAYELIAQIKTPECREVLMLRYLMGKRKPLTWLEIAQQMEYSEQHVKEKLHGKAISEAREVWKVWAGSKRIHRNTIEPDTVILAKSRTETEHSSL